MEFKELINGLITQKYTKIKEECEPVPYTFKVERVSDDKELCNVHFQQGPIKECGINGVCGEDLIAMVIRRLEGFQSTAFKCKENEKAIEKFQEGLMWLRKRTNDREIAGIEGTHIINPDINYIYLDESTTNKSFLDLYNELKLKNINVSYILGLYNKSLKGVDPYDKNLSPYIKTLIIKECINNIWYFLREIVKIPMVNEDSTEFKINLSKLIILFSMHNNLDSIIELPRNTWEDMYPVECILLYELITSGVYNSTIISSNIDLSNLKLDIIYKMIKKLPYYLRSACCFKDNAIKEGFTNSSINIEDVKILKNISSNKKIKSGIYNKKIFFDLNHIESSNIILKNILEDKQENYGITILGVPSNLITDEEKYLYGLENESIKFNLSWLSLSEKQIKEMLDINKKSIFIHIKISYKELGYSEQWFNDNCKSLNNNNDIINKELLLEWNI